MAVSDQNRGPHRKALCIGVADFNPSAKEDDESDIETYPRLPSASDKAAELADVLRSFGYISDCVSSAGELVAASLGGKVHQTLAEADSESIVIVHILSHGHLEKSPGSGSLYVIGSDGVRHPATKVEEWLTQVEDFRDQRPLTLFILDLCHAGKIARIPWQMKNASEDVRAWVIAATTEDGQAFDGNFTECVIRVLKKLRDGHFDIHPRMTNIPLETVAREVRREASAQPGYPQQVTATIRDISAEAMPRFFPIRPKGRNISDAGDPRVQQFAVELDQALDVPHFYGRAQSRSQFNSEAMGCFQGRRQHLVSLSAWMDDPGAPNGLKVITGCPGVGKSALIGVLVCAAHPELRDATERVWHHVARAPSRNPHLVAVHARQRGLREITASLARQLSIADAPATGWRPDALVEKMREKGVRPLIIIDALDEAHRPLEIMNSLLLPLTSSSDGPPICRLMCGTRKIAHLTPLMEAALQQDGLIDLDDVPKVEIKEDVYHYVDQLLRSTPPYDGIDYAPVRDTFAETLSGVLTDRPTDNLTQDCGHFLVAALYTHHIITRNEPMHDVHTARRYAHGAPQTLPEIFELDLQSDATDEWLRPVLAALARAYRDGMPRTVLRRIVPAFVGHRPGEQIQVTDDDIRDALAIGRFYLRAGADRDGTSVYRLFHQSLADHLIAYPITPERPPPPNLLDEIFDMICLTGSST